MKTLWELKEDIEATRDELKDQKRVNKTKLISQLTQLAEHAHDLECKLHDECYSRGAVSEMIDDHLARHEQAKRRELQRTDAEDHRKRFGIIRGGAA